MSELLSIKTPKAIKDHRCDYCNQVIHKWSIYNAQTLVGDDGIYLWRNHLYCQELAVKLNWFEEASSNGDEGLSGDAFREGVFEEHKDIMISEGFYSIHQPMPFQERLDKVLNHYGIIKNA